ncbi:MAG: site-specific DNA-methyltransferase [Anaerolineae bacterium]|nr:site-specific DNA-methyltransferase [Anaerolineae bacterium]
MAQKSRPIETYEHQDKQRANNPPVGLVTPATDPDVGLRQTYAYDPHLDPQLQWAGKAEHTAFEVPTVSLHVHERIDPRTIIEAVRRAPDPTEPVQLALFQMPEENPPLREAIEFYQHAHGWSNRLVAGDSLLVMNSLLEKEGLGGKVQMVYMDPPYGIKYGSNFQPFVNKRDVRDGKDEDLTAEPEQIRAFRDTWELGIHSYLTYLRDRLLLARELLADSGSVFVQISDENVHHVHELMDEVFGYKNFVSLVSFVTTSGFESRTLARNGDYLLWYAKDSACIKYHSLYYEKDTSLEGGRYRWFLLPDGTMRSATVRELRGEDALPEGVRLYQPTSLISQGASESTVRLFKYKGKDYDCGGGNHWKTTIEGLENLAKAGRIHVARNSIRFVRFADDFPWQLHTNIWNDTATGNFTDEKVYVVQTATKVIQRCLLMTTDPGDLVFDPTCGSGTTAYVAEQWGRRWITCDTSRVALTLARQRLMTATFDYYELARPQEGVGSGFVYKTVSHVTLKSIANNEPPAAETLYDQPAVDTKKRRVSGPFTVEAVPAPAVQSVDDLLLPSPAGGRGAASTLARGEGADLSVSRSGETLRQGEWRDELLRAGIRGKAGQTIRFARLEPLPGCAWLHADGETSPSAEGADSVREQGTAYAPQRIVVSFGPQHAPLEQRQVELAIEDAQTLVPRPKLIVFAAFQFDPEAAKDIDETNWPGVTLLKAQMNADLLTDDLKKKRASNESFWLIGQPDVRLERIARGDDADGHHPKGKWQVSVEGFDYYNTRTGGIESGGANQIAVWLLDTDYDGRSLFPRQVFFPQAGESEGWARLARNLKAEVDEELIEAYRGTVSLPFAAGKHKRIAVKIVDDRGIESLKILEVD